MDLKATGAKAKKWGIRLVVGSLLLFVVGYWYTGLMSLLQGRFSGVAMGGDSHTKPFPVGV